MHQQAQQRIRAIAVVPLPVLRHCLAGIALAHGSLVVVITLEPPAAPIQFLLCLKLEGGAPGIPSMSWRLVFLPLWCAPQQLRWAGRCCK